VTFTSIFYDFCVCKLLIFGFQSAMDICPVYTPSPPYALGSAPMHAEPTQQKSWRGPCAYQGTLTLESMSLYNVEWSFEQLIPMPNTNACGLHMYAFVVAKRSRDLLRDVTTHNMASEVLFLHI